MIGWGGSTGVALIAVVFVSQTAPGSARLEQAFNVDHPTPAAVAMAPKPARPVAKVAPRAAEASTETKRLAAQLRELTADRDRLAARLASLERRLEDMTGSIERRTTPVAAVLPSAAPPPAPKQSVTSATPAGEPVESMLGMLPKIAAIIPPPSEAPRIIEPLAMTAAAQDITAHWAAPPKRPTANHIASVVPIPMARPVRVAAAPTREHPVAPPQPELGVDIGGALTPSGLSGQWSSVKANFGPLLAGLYPVIGRDHRFGHFPFRLLIGPVPNETAAARLCANLAPAGIECHPARFEGPELAQR